MYGGFMKYLLASMILFPCFAQATEYKFTFFMGRDRLEYKVSAPNKTQAYKIAASFCFDFFANKTSNLTDDVGREIIDACANPAEF
jgi:hypothetical protein